MITVQEAERLIQDNNITASVILSSIENPSREVLQENFYADRDYPPFERAAMDGIAICYESWKNGQRNFVHAGIQAAGTEQKILKDRTQCFEIMTGAVVPSGADCVVRIEDLEISNGVAKLSEGLALEPWQNVHRLGSDHKIGDLVVKAGEVLNGPQWAVAASIGKANVKVSSRPRIAVVSTGDELVPVEASPLPHQMRLSNGHAIKASLAARGFNKVEVIHLPDNREILVKRLEIILQEFDILILSGGVSMGKFDFIPGVLADLKVRNIFHKIKQKPGKPLWFGVKDSQKLVFGLPGNPVSVLVCLHRYVLPALEFSFGKHRYAVLQKEVSFNKDMTLFKPVRIEYASDGRILAWPVATNGSGDFSGLAGSDGFLQLDATDSNVFLSGESFPYWPWGAS